MSIKYLITFILFLKVLFCFSQTNYRFINFGIKEGLSDNFAYAATQDQLGYMWFATPSGLYRYDGILFKNIRSPLDKPGRAISNILQTVYTSKNGTIWLGGFNTLQWYNPNKNLFWGPQYKNSVVTKLCDAYILNFTEDGKKMWIATSNNNFFQFNGNDSSFTHFGNALPKTASKSTLKIILIKNNLWVVQSEGIYLFSEDVIFKAFYPSEASISNATYDNDKILITTYQSGLIEFDISKRRYNYKNLFNVHLKTNNLFCINNSLPNELWIGSYPLYKINITTNTISTIPLSAMNEYGLKASKIGSIYTDRERNIWICGNTGLSMLPWQNQQIETIQLIDNRKIIVEPLNVFAVNNSDNLIISNISNNGVIYYDAQHKSISSIKDYTQKQAHPKQFTGIVQTKDGNIYTADNTNFYKFLVNEKKLVLFPLKDQNNKSITLVGRNVYDKKGNVYIASNNNGFYIWNTITNKLTHFNKWDVIADLQDKTDNTILPSYLDSKGNVWFTGTVGVYKLNTNENKFYHYAYMQNAEIPLLSKSNFIVEDKFGHYWITTNNNGLYELYFDNNKEMVKNFTQNSGIGLPSDYLIKIKADLKDSSLWITYNSGLLKFDPIQKKVLTIFKKQNGLWDDAGGNTFNITPNNKLVQLFYGGMSTIDLNTYQFNETPPSLVFNSIKVLDVEKKYNIDIDNPILHLSYKENFLQFEFAALTYNNSNQVQYCYQLIGVDADWIFCGKRNTISYSGLPSGSYTLKIKAANNDGLWSTKELVIKIIIHPPIYKTWWFIALSIALLFGLAYTWNRYRINQVRQKEILKATFQEQIAQTEMKALRAQMNPHFIFNSLNSIQKYILENNHFEASQYLTKFSRLIRLILDHSNQNNILLSSEIELLKLYVEMESLRFDNKFDYTIYVTADISTETIEIPSMLVQPYVENAIWHGLLHKENKGLLTIIFAKNEENELIATIEDNGIGREKAGVLKSKQVLKKKSYGIQITENRIALINKMQNINTSCSIEDLKDYNNNSLGTKITIRIPIKQIKP